MQSFSGLRLQLRSPRRRRLWVRERLARREEDVGDGGIGRGWADGGSRDGRRADPGVGVRVDPWGRVAEDVQHACDARARGRPVQRVPWVRVRDRVGFGLVLG